MMSVVDDATSVMLEHERGWKRVIDHNYCGAATKKEGDGMSESSLQLSIISAGKWGLLRRTAWWLTCSYPADPGKMGMSFQVGEFRDYHSADLAKQRLTNAIRKQYAAEKEG